MYTPAVRELCYSLLANQIPPAKVTTTIQAVLKCFMPSLDLHTIKLPSEGCASYMRRQELTTISMVHKATKITEEAQSGTLHLNSDGTTISQKKLQGVAMNGMIVSVNEVPDGTADSIINDISKELQKVREIAHYQMQIRSTGLLLYHQHLIALQHRNDSTNFDKTNGRRMRISLVLPARMQLR